MRFGVGDIGFMTYSPPIQPFLGQSLVPVRGREIVGLVFASFGSKAIFSVTFQYRSVLT